MNRCVDCIEHNDYLYDTLCISHSVSACVALPLGLQGSIPETPAAPTNGATGSVSDKPKVSLCMGVINSLGLEC